MINIEQLLEIYSTELNGAKNNAWTTISDSKSGEITTNSGSGSSDDFGNGWQVHISIDPSRIGTAAVLIALILNEEDSPRVGVKFSSKGLALSGQPCQQVVLRFYEDSLTDSSRINTLFNKIEDAFTARSISADLRDKKSDDSTNRHCSILHESGEPSRFNYCNEDSCQPNKQDLQDPFVSIRISPKIPRKVFDARPFQYVRGCAGYHLSFSSRETLPSREELLEQSRRNFAQMLGCKTEQSQEEKLRIKRDKVLQKYEILLASGQAQRQELNALIEQHKDKFIQLQNLDDKYAQMYTKYSELEGNWVRKSASYTAKSQSINTRKQGFFSNIKYHFNNNDNQREFNKSMLIVPGIFLGSCLTIVGGIVLIPTINTFLLPMAITMIGIGLTLMISAFILVKMDFNNALKEDAQYQSQVKELTKQYQQSGDELFNTYNEIRAITF